MSAGAWHLYIMRCRNGALYTGITTDVERRMQQHQSGKGARSLRGNPPEAVIFSAELENRSEASRLEYYVKRLSRSEKLALTRRPESLHALVPCEEH